MSTKIYSIDPILYKGALSYFRAWMDVYLSHGDSIFYPDLVNMDEVTKKAFDEQKEGDIIDFTRYYPRLVIKYSEIDQSPNREVWYAGFYEPLLNGFKNQTKKLATILAVETSPGNTTVEFLDGLYFRLRTPNGTLENARTELITDPFSNYVEHIKKQWQENLQKKKKPRKRARKKINKGTVSKIILLAEERQKAIDERGNVPGWIDACNLIGIDSRIVIKHAKELSDNWADKRYRWPGFEEN